MACPKGLENAKLNAFIHFTMGSHNGSPRHKSEILVLKYQIDKISHRGSSPLLGTITKLRTLLDRPTLLLRPLTNTEQNPKSEHSI